MNCPKCRGLCEDNERFEVEEVDDNGDDFMLIVIEYYCCDCGHAFEYEHWPE